jgi:hypothetical protein
MLKSTTIVWTDVKWKYFWDRFLKTFGSIVRSEMGKHMNEEILGSFLHELDGITGLRNGLFHIPLALVAIMYCIYNFNKNYFKTTSQNPDINYRTFRLKLEKALNNNCFTKRALTLPQFFKGPINE